jgi:iron complex outermembrane receptor protein
LSLNPAGPAIGRDYSQRILSTAAWAEFAWDFFDDLALEGGVRYNWERKEFELERRDLVPGITAAPVSTDQDETFQSPTGTLALRYYFDERLNAYLKYARGYKAGHFNALPGRLLIDTPPAKAEKNDSWEVGIGGYVLQGLVAGRMAFFYYRYQQYQLFNFRDDPQSPPVLEILNAEEAQNYGVEFEFRLEPLRGWSWRPIEGLLIQGTAAWLHGEYVDFQLVEPEEFSGGIVLPISNDFSGNQLQNSPEFSFSAAAEWTFDLGRFGFIVPRYDVNWTDDVYFNIREGRGLTNTDGSELLPEYAVGQSSFFLHNVRLGYRTPTGNVEVAVWCRNLEDRVYKTFAADVTKFRGVVVNFVGEPRTIGVDLIVTF